MRRRGARRRRGRRRRACVISAVHLVDQRAHLAAHRRRAGAAAASASSLRMRPGSLDEDDACGRPSSPLPRCCATRSSIALVGMRPPSHSSRMSSRRRLAGQHVERGKGFVHQQHVRVRRPARARCRRAGACRPTARAAARPRSRPGRSARAWRRRARCALRRRARLCASSPSSTFCCTVSQGNSANDWNTIADAARRPVQRLAAVGDRGRRRPRSGRP